MSQDIEEPELRRRIISGARWVLFLRTLAQASSWLVSIVVIRFLTPTDYGLNAMLEVPLEMMLLFSMLGLDRALIQKRESSREELAATFGVLLLVNISFFLILSIGAEHIASYFKEPRLTNLIRVAAVVFLLLPFRVIPNALLDRDLAFKQRAKAELIASLLSSLLCLLLAINGAGVWALVTAMVVNTVLRAILLSYIRPWITLPSLKFGLAKDLMRRGGMLTASALLWVVSGKIIDLIAGPVIGVEALGQYAVAFQFALLAMSKFMPIIMQTMYPAFAHLEGRPSLVNGYITKTIEISSFFIFPLSVGLACVSSSFVVVIFGDKWSSVIFPLALLSVVTPIRMITNILTPALNALGHVSSVFWIYLTLCGLLAVGASVAAKWGLLGLVGLWLIVTPVITLITLVVAKAKLNLAFLDVIKASAPAAISSSVMAMPLLILEANWEIKFGAVRLLTEIGLGALVYVLMLYVFFKPRLKEILFHIFPRK